MKTIFLTLLSFLILACSEDKDDNNPVPPVSIDVNAKLSINLKNTPQSKSGEIGEDTMLLRKIITNVSDIRGYDVEPRKNTQGGIADWQKDTVNFRLLFRGADVIRLASDTSVVLGYLSTGFLNVVFIQPIPIPGKPGWTAADTIAYIPNTILKSIHQRIKAALEAKDYEECYRIFNKEYVAYPCTGEQYRKLVADGKEIPYLTGMVVESWYMGIYDDIYPKNSQYWQEFGVNNDDAQEWHIFWYGEKFKE